MGRVFRRANYTIHIIMGQLAQNTPIKSALKDIYLYIVWGKFSNEYFKKSSSWLYNKLNGRDGNGGVGAFSNNEKELLRESLLDFSNRIRNIAENL